MVCHLIYEFMFKLISQSIWSIHVLSKNGQRFPPDLKQEVVHISMIQNIQQLWMGGSSNKLQADSKTHQTHTRIISIQFNFPGCCRSSSSHHEKQIEIRLERGEK